MNLINGVIYTRKHRISAFKPLQKTSYKEPVLFPKKLLDGKTRNVLNFRLRENLERSS